MKFYTHLLLFFSLVHLSFGQNSSVDLPEDFPLPEKYYPVLNEILQEAQTQAPRIIDEKLKQEIFDEELRIAKSEYWPRVNAGGNYGYSRQYITETGETNQNSGGGFNVGASRPLFRWGALRASVDIGKINYRINSRNVVTNYQNIVNGLRLDYLSLIVNKLEQESLLLEKTIAEDTLNLERGEFQAGRLSKQTYQVSLSEFQKSLLKADQILFEQQQIENSFQRLSGAKRSIEPEDYLPPINIPSLNSWLDRKSNTPHEKWFLTHRSILNQEDAITREERNYTIARSRQLPNFNFSTSANQGFTNTSTSNNVLVINFFAGISAGWNLFDGFATQAQKQKVRIQEDRMHLEMTQLKLDLIEEELDLRKAVEFALRGLEIESSLFSLAEEQFENHQKDFKQNLISANTMKAKELVYLESKLAYFKRSLAVFTDLLDYIALINQDPLTKNLSLTESR